MAKNRPMFDALMMISTHDITKASETATRVREELDLPALIAEVVRDGQEAGVIRGDEAPKEYAAILTNNLLIRAFTRREHTPEEVAATVTRTMFAGILTENEMPRQ